MRARRGLAIAALGLSSGLAYAQTTLPYTTRTRGYSGTRASIHGDITDVSMAGATVGLGSSYTAMFKNPAGLAMTFDRTGFQYVGNTFYDDKLQDYSQGISTSSFVAGSSMYPWGIGLGYLTPYAEGQVYNLSGGGQVQPEVYIKEFHAAAGRVFWENRIAVGVGIKLAQGNRELSYPNSATPSDAVSSTTLGAVFGGLLQLPNRWLIGMSYTPESSFGGDMRASTGILNFWQPIRAPSLFRIGTGWIPNRFFRVGAELYVIGGRNEMALLSDDTVIVGDSTSLQPRFGMLYKLIEFKEFKAEFGAGAYYEAARTAGHTGRIHGTTGIDMNVWILNLGFAADLASGYKNFQYSLGIDIIRALQKLDLVPTPWQPPSGGFFPDPTMPSDAGLPRALVREWNPEAKPIDILEVGRELPQKLVDKFENAPKSLKELGKEVADTFKGKGKGKAKPTREERKKSAPRKRPTQP